jgi:apolipoprotein N-acyltransferase
MVIEKYSNLTRVAIGLLLSITGGVAFVLAFPPYELWPLVFIGFVPVLVAQYRIMPPKLTSLASATAIAVWLQGYLGPVFAPVGTFMVWLPLMAFVLSFLFDRGQRGFHDATGYRWFVIAGVISWAAIEMIRLFLPIAGTWAFIAYPLYRQLWLIQPASVFGIIGTGMLVMLVNHVLALQAIGWLDRRWLKMETTDPVVPYQQPLSFKLQRRWALTGGVIVLGWLVISVTLLNLPLNTPFVTVAAVQPSVSPIVSINQDLDVDLLHSRMIEQTREAAEKGAQFLVWSEAAFNFDPQVEDRLDLVALAKETNSYLVPGYIVMMGEEGFRNEATIISPEGLFLGVFGKDHPVVFGGETSLSRGTYPVYETELGNLATIICYDLDYTDTTRKMVAQGAQLIGVPSNDWGSIADKHYTHVVFRAIENRVAMVKADGSFDSAIIDPYGRILELAVYPEGGEATLVADLQIGNGRGTVNTHLGDWLGWLALAGLAFFTFGGSWLIKKSKQQ